MFEVRLALDDTYLIQPWTCENWMKTNTIWPGKGTLDEDKSRQRFISKVVETLSCLVHVLSILAWPDDWKAGIMGAPRGCMGPSTSLSAPKVKCDVHSRIFVCNLANRV